MTTSRDLRSRDLWGADMIFLLSSRSGMSAVGLFFSSYIFSDPNLHLVQCHATISHFQIDYDELCLFFLYFEDFEPEV